MSVLVRRPADDLDGLLVSLLHEWLASRRWFPLKGAAVESLTVSDALHLDDESPWHDDAPPADAVVRVLLVRARHDLTEHVIQVPVVVAGRDEAVAPHAVVATLPRDGGRAVLDGAADPRFVAAWLAGAQRASDDALALDPTSARAISGEQSNTSVLLGSAPGLPPTAILKVLRTLAPGENPDVDVPRRLASLGWPNVPAPLAWLTGAWRSEADPDRPEQEHEGHLGVLAAFVSGARDGFELACDLANATEPFDALATELGATVGGLHQALRAAYPDAVARVSTDDVAANVAERFAWASAAVPRLAGYADAVADALTSLRAVDAAPVRQRVHGDLHLGQVLRGPDRWYVLDFEGEPAAPLEARTRPDLALRDVAGVLRSIDYAAAVGGLVGDDARRWCSSARTALLAGYQDDLPEPTRAALLRALELDKALYEAVYESRNRPDWLHIPLAGLDRLLG